MSGTRCPVPGAGLGMNRGAAAALPGLHPRHCPGRARTALGSHGRDRWDRGSQRIPSIPPHPLWPFIFRGRRCLHLCFPATTAASSSLSPTLFSFPQEDFNEICP